MRWVVFDYGEVISKPTAELPALAARLGVPEPAFAAAYWPCRDAYDRGGSDLDFWRAVGERVGVPVDEALAGELTERDIAEWLHPDPAAVDLLAELDAAGVPLALLSNAPVSFARVASRQAWTKHFRHLVFSGDLGVAKPDPAIWAALAERLGADPADCVFLDDRQVNIDGAVAAGMTGVLWRGGPGARDELARLLGL